MKRGLPELISQFGTPILTLCMNYVLIRQLGDMAVSTFAILSYLTSISMGIFLGVSEGLQPLIGKCYGSKSEENLKYYFRAGSIINFIGGAVIYVIFLLFGKNISAIFNSDTILIQTVSEALPAFGWAFIIMPLNLIISVYLYSTKRTRAAVITNVSRCFVFIPLTILLLPLIFGNEIVWYTVGIAETLSFIVSIVILKHSEKNGVRFH